MEKKKIFVRPEEMRNAAFRLGAEIYATGFYPDVIYIVLRGGADTGNPISEFFKWVRMHHDGLHRADPSHPKLRRVLFAAVTARSYPGAGEEPEQVRVEGWTYHPDHLRCDDRILFLDDVYDRGLTLSHLVGVVMDRGIPRSDIKIAVHDYKQRRYLDPQPLVIPDFWSRQHVLERPEDDPWIHYLSHELEGLAREEMQEHIFRNDPKLLEFLFQTRARKPSRT